MAPAYPAEPALAAGAPPRAARAAALAVAVLLVTAAVVLAALSFASYATVKHRLDSFASDHDADLSRSRFDGIVVQVRILAVLLLAAGAAVAWRRQRLAEVLDAFIRAAAADTVASLASLRRGLAAGSRLHLGALAAIVAGGLLVRLDFLFQPMRYDESGTYVHYASEPLYIGLSTYTAPNNHLLHTALVHVSTALFGNEPWAIRLPAFVAGVLLVPASYLAARLLYDRWTALVSAALVATSSTLVEYSTNARGYTLVALLFVLLLALASRLRESPSVGGWAAFALLGGLGFYTIPTFLYAFGTITLWLLWTILAERRPASLLRRRLLPALVATAALTIVLYAPVIATSGVHAITRNQFVAPQTWTYFAHHLPGSLRATFARWHRDQPTPLWLLLAGGFVVACALHARVSRFRVPPAVAALVFVAPVLAVQHVVPFERVWSFLLPLYLMTATAGVLLAFRRIEARPSWSPALALAGVAVCAGLAGTVAASRNVARSEDTSTFRDAPGVSSFLERTVRPGDRVLVSPPADLILEYYLDRAGLDAGRLLYADFRARRLFAVVKEGPRQYPLHVVLSQHLSPGEARRLRPVVLRRFPHAVVYRLLGASSLRPQTP